jgi:hypothetical protein
MSGDSTQSSDLRDFFLAKKLRSTKLDVDGRTIEIREPSLAVRDEFLKRMEYSGQVDAEGNPVRGGSIGRAQVYLVIMCAYDPDTGKKIFKAADESSLVTQVAPQGFIKRIVDAAMEFMNNAPEKAKN